MRQIFLLIVFLVLLSLLGCDDNQILPYKITRERTLASGVTLKSFIDDLDNNAASELITVERTYKKEVSSLIKISDLETGYHYYSEPIWGEILDVKAFDVDGDRYKEIVYTYRKVDSLYLKIYQPFQEGQVLLQQKILVGKRRFPNRPWQGRFEVQHLVDLNHDGFKDLVMVICGGYDRYPRGVLVYDLQNRRELWHYWVGPIINKVHVYDLNGDGRYEIYLDNWSPANRAEANQTDDFHSYLIVLSETGKLLFQKELGGKNSATLIYFPRFTPGKAAELVTLTKTSNFDLSTGNRLIKWHYQNFPYLFPKVENTRLIFGEAIAILKYQLLPHFFVSNGEGQLCVLDSTLKLVSVFSYPEKLLWYYGQFDLNGDGIEETVCGTQEHHTLILNTDFKMIARGEELRHVFLVKRGRTKPPAHAFFYANGNIELVKLQRLTIFDYLKGKRYLRVSLLVLGFIIALGALKLAYGGDWNWYREQLKFLAESFTATISLDRKGRISWMNSRAEELFGRKFEEVKGKPIEELLQGRFAPLREQLRKQLSSRQNARWQVRLSTEEAEHVFEIQVQFILSTLRRREGILVLFNDITPLIHSRKTVSWLMVAQKMAHEIKNPLTSIRLSLQRLKYEYENNPELQKKIAEFVEGGLEEVNRLRRVLDDFMRFSRIQSPRMNLINLKEIIEEVVQRYRLHLPETINLKTEISDPNLTVFADESQMVTLFTNLIDNAIQATQEPGEILIKLFEAERIQDDLIHPLKKEIVLEVSDTGRGMDADTRNRLFDPFFTTREGGSGLGMNIVKRIVEEHQGTIEVFSRPGLGTRITISFPLNNRQVKS